MRAYNLKPDLFEVKGKTVVLKAKLHNQTGVSVISSNKSNIISYIVKTTPSRPASAKVSQPPQPQVTNRIDLTITNAHRQRYQELLAKEASNAGKRVVHFKVKPAPNNQEFPSTKLQPQQEPSKYNPEYEFNEKQLNQNTNNRNRRPSSTLKNNSKMKKLIKLQKWWRLVIQNSYLFIRKYEITHFSRQSVSLMDKNYILIQSFSHKLLRIRILFLERRSKFKQDYLFYFDLSNLQDVLQIQPSEDQYEFNLFVNQVILQLLSLYQITNNQLDININSQLQVEVKQLQKIIELQLIENSMFIFGILINEIQQLQKNQQEIIFENNEEDYNDSFEKEEDNQILQNQNNEELQNFNQNNNLNVIESQDKYEQEFEDNLQINEVKFEENNFQPKLVIPQLEQSQKFQNSLNQLSDVQNEDKLEDKQENKQVDKQVDYQVDKQVDKQEDKQENKEEDKYEDIQKDQWEEQNQNIQKNNQNQNNDKNKIDVYEEYKRDQTHKSIDNFDKFQESSQNQEKQDKQYQKLEPKVENLQQNQNYYVEKVEYSQSKQDIMDSSMKNKQSELVEFQNNNFQQFNQVEIEISNEQILKNENQISNEKQDKYEEKNLSQQEQFEEYENLSQYIQENEEKIVNQQQNEEKDLNKNQHDIKYDEKSNNDEQMNENSLLESKQLYNGNNNDEEQKSDKEYILEQNSIKQIDNNLQQQQIEESQKQINGVVIISQQIDLFPKDKNLGSQKLINDYLEITSQYQSQQNQQKLEDQNIYESIQIKTQEIKQSNQYEKVDSQILDDEEEKQFQQKEILQVDLNVNLESQIMNEKILETQENKINQIQKEENNQDINNIIETYLQEILYEFIELQRPKKIEIINKQINLFEGISEKQQHNQQLEIIESIQERRPPNKEENHNQPLMQLSYNTQNLSLAYSKESLEPPHKKSWNQELDSNEFIKSKGLQQIQFDQEYNSLYQSEQTPYPQPVNLQKLQNADQFNSERINTLDEDGMYQTFKFQLTQGLELNHQGSQRDSLKDSLVYSDASNISNSNLQSIQYNVSRKETTILARIFYNNIEIQVFKQKDGYYRLQDRENNFKGYDIVNHFDLNQEQFVKNHGVYIIKNQILCIPLINVIKIQKFVKRLRLKCTCKLVFQNKSTFLFLFTSVVSVILQKYSTNQFKENIKLSNLSKRDLDILKNQFEYYSPLFLCYEKQDVIDLLKIQKQNPQFFI